MKSDGRPGTARPETAGRLADDGYVFPIEALTANEALAIRARIEALEAGPVGRGPEAQKLYRFKPYMIFRWAAELVRHPGVLDAVEAAIGPDIMIWAVGLFIKEPLDPTPIRWHQDGTYMGLSDNDAPVRAWLALSETTVANGTMSFLPSSHSKGFVTHHEDDASRHIALRGEHIKDPDGIDAAVPVLLTPGQMSLHHMRTIHGSPGNTTDRRRMTVAMTFLPPHVHPLSGRDTATLVRGEDRYGHWMTEQAMPAEEFDAGCRDAHRKSMDIRYAAYHGSTMPHS